MTHPIPMIEVHGNYRDVGRQIGQACQPQIQRALTNLCEGLPEGINWEVVCQQGQRYLEFSRQIYPHYVEELEGIAEGADVPFEEVFLSICEELWEAAAWRGCTDMAARGRATLDGSTLIAHTNDLRPCAEENLVLLKIQAGDEPEFLGVSPDGGIAISAGLNAAGISLTGNQLDNNDIRPGVPRLLMVRATLSSRHLSEAMSHCLLPERASSYNNVLADANGEIYSMEGSATDCEPIYIKDDILAHANHYISPAMRCFEADRNRISNSILRHNRALRLLRENYGQLSPELFKKLLADHAGYPTSICNHGTDSVTVFSIIIQLENLRAWIGRGRACETEYVEYQLEPYQSAT